MINFSQPIKGQRAIYQEYTVEDGLPSNTIYQIAQDSKGYIWVATGTGASRFNGTDFNHETCYTVPNEDIDEMRNADLETMFGQSIYDLRRIEKILMSKNKNNELRRINNG